MSGFGISRPVFLVIGYGNRLRRDDGAGPELAERMAQTPAAQEGGLVVLIVHQLMPELAEEIAQDAVEAVVFLDASVGGSVRVCPVSPGAVSPGVGHHSGPEAVMTYAHLLYGRRPPAWVLTIPGADFEHGEGLSAQTREAVDEAYGLLCDWLRGRVSNRAVRHSLAEGSTGCGSI